MEYLGNGYFRIIYCGEIFVGNKEEISNFLTRIINSEESERA